MTDTARLLGATEPPPPDREPSPGEFAALWNSWDHDRRVDFMGRVSEWRTMSERCFIEDHAGTINRSRMNSKAVSVMARAHLAAPTDQTASALGSLV